MLKFLILLCSIAGFIGAVDFSCYTQPITSVMLGGNLPLGANNLTDVPNGTNCTFTFVIPTNYVLLLKFSWLLASENDSVIIFDNNGNSRFSLHQFSYPVFDKQLWMPAKSTKVQVVGKSGDSKFFMSYVYQSIDNYTKVSKRTGEPISLRSMADNTFTTVTSLSAGEKVVLTPGTRAGSSDSPLVQYFVYDGDSITGANFLGRLSELQKVMKSSTGQSVSIVRFSEEKSGSYVLGNDASALNGFGEYNVFVTSRGNMLANTLNDSTTSVKGTANTFICVDCSTFYLSKLSFYDSTSLYKYITLQGQTPTHKREQLIQYDSNTLTANQFPQMLPTNVFTMNIYRGKADYNLNTINDDTAWKRPYVGRKGYIFSPSLWTSAANNFTYEFRDNSQNFNFTLNMQKMSFPASSDQMTLKIGSGSGTPAVNKQYPRDQTSNSQVMANGNYMQVGLSASVGADVRLSFEIQKGNSAKAVGVLVTIVLTLFYSF
ncbi:hypothetical protein GCK72_020533 [Caenorhabditis remanei]|uniref:CUB-like domain-containing protein n=1 Tax=Caenorhabditis remanei TaxID=31234 RepID=A0A6A5GH34_CAERE|nr:hypothetical protein GCK72_020533 [Caenorhabditis remanei]KAF1753976.1 hypothetical protein GCK72_020533 [Caenorhabditis remanei]